MSKPRKPAPKFSPHKWGVTVDAAFVRIEAAVGTLHFAEKDINEGLRSERLKSGEWQISPDGEGTWRRLNSSDWAQRSVRAHRSMFAPRPEVFSLAPREGTYIEGPQFAGQVFICRADLDKHYRIAATPTMPLTQRPHRARRPHHTSPHRVPRRRWPHRELRHTSPHRVPRHTSPHRVTRLRKLAGRARRKRPALRRSGLPVRPAAHPHR
jgi:hypothetical protein